MTIFLLLVSLLLNGVAIFSIIILFTRQNRLLEVERKQEKLIKDVEEIISSSILEMKEENESFIKRFQKISSQPIVTHPPSREGKNNNLTEAKPEQDIKKKTGNALKQQAVKAYQNSPIIPEANESYTTVDIIPTNLEENIEITHLPCESTKKSPIVAHEDIYRDLFVNQVLILQKQGLTSEEIAKKLGKGKTEIELLLKFGQNN